MVRREDRAECPATVRNPAHAARLPTEVLPETVRRVSSLKSPEVLPGCVPSFGSVRSYVDTTGAHFVTLPDEIPALRERLTGRATDSRVHFDDVAGNQGWLLALHQGTPEEQDEFTALIRECEGAPHYATFNRLDIGTDFEPAPGWSLERLQHWFECTTVLRRRRSRHMRDRDDENILYWSDDLRAETLLLAYHDARGKLSDGPCVHFDLRFQRARKVKQVGFHYPNEAENANPAKLWEDHVQHVDHRTPEFFAIAERLHLKNGHPAEEWDRDHALWQLNELEMRRAQNLKEFYPAAFAELAEIPASRLGIPHRVEWGAVKRHRHHRKTLWL